MNTFDTSTNNSEKAEEEKERFDGEAVGEYPTPLKVEDRLTMLEKRLAQLETKKRDHARLVDARRIYRVAEACGDREREDLSSTREKGDVEKNPNSLKWSIARVWKRWGRSGEKG